MLRLFAHTCCSPCSPAARSMLPTAPSMPPTAPSMPPTAPSMPPIAPSLLSPAPSVLPLAPSLLPIYTPNLGLRVAVSVREREQGRFRGSNEGARGSSEGAGGSILGQCKGAIVGAVVSMREKSCEIRRLGVKPHFQYTLYIRIKARLKDLQQPHCSSRTSSP